MDRTARDTADPLPDEGAAVRIVRTGPVMEQNLDAGWVGQPVRGELVRSGFGRGVVDVGVYRLKVQRNQIEVVGD